MVDRSKEFSFDESDDFDLEATEQFKESVDAFKRATWGQPFQVLVDSGISLPPPDALTDSELKAKLWEVVNALALMGAYLEHTDHLTDRELYVVLWGDVLHEEMAIQSGMGSMAFYIDMAGSGGEADLEAYLKYYADDEERVFWKSECSGEGFPDRESLPFDRDRLLPRPGAELNAKVH